MTVQLEETTVSSPEIVKRDPLAMIKGAFQSRRHLEDTISTLLDIWKGFFVFFMITEHTRSSLNVSMAANRYPWMHFVSQVACALDMTTFSTAYGFSCWRSYLSGFKSRPFGETAGRLLRSVGMIYTSALICNITFATQVLNEEPTFKLFLELATLSTVYWDFIFTFIFLLLLGLVFTGPILRFAAKQSTILKFSLFALTLAVPLCFANETFAVHAGSPNDCNTVPGRYLALFVGCSPTQFRGTRFPAIPYMFFFNLGCILSIASIELGNSLPDAARPADVEEEPLISPPIETTPTKTYLWFFGFVLLIDALFALPLFAHFSEPWEEYNRTFKSESGLSLHYLRFPLSAPLALGWGFMSFLALCCSVAVYLYFKPIAKILESFGANVLLYFTFNALLINGFFRTSWREAAADPRAAGRWQVMTLLFGLGSLGATSFLIYMGRSARK